LLDQAVFAAQIQHDAAPRQVALGFILLRVQERGELAIRHLGLVDVERIEGHLVRWLLILKPLSLAVAIGLLA
jgi:hypothetical protein